MQILANALPGFRDMRAPLTAGYLWVVFVWFVTTPDLSQRPSHPILASAYDLASSAGPLWVGFAIGTMAYLAGSITQLGAERGEQWWNRRNASISVPNSAPDPYEPEAARDDRQNSTLNRLPSQRVMADKYLETQGRLYRFRDGDEKWEAWIERLAETYFSSMGRAAQEVDLPATVLVGAEPGLFAEVDRLRAEGELRITIAPPLIALTLLMSIGVSPWFLLCLLGVAALLAQGVEKKSESRRVITSAMTTGRIDSPAAKDFEATMDAFVAEVGRDHEDSRREG